MSNPVKSFFNIFIQKMTARENDSNVESIERYKHDLASSLSLPLSCLSLSLSLFELSGLSLPLSLSSLVYLTHSLYLSFVSLPLSLSLSLRSLVCPPLSLLTLFLVSLFNLFYLHLFSLTHFIRILDREASFFSFNYLYLVSFVLPNCSMSKKKIHFYTLHIFS